MAPPSHSSSRLAQRLISFFPPALSPQLSSYGHSVDPSRAYELPHTSVPPPSPRPSRLQIRPGRPVIPLWDDYPPFFNPPEESAAPPRVVDEAVEPSELADEPMDGPPSSSPATVQGASTPIVELPPPTPPTPTSHALAQALFAPPSTPARESATARPQDPARDPAPHLQLSSVDNGLASTAQAVLSTDGPSTKSRPKPFVHLPNLPELVRETLPDVPAELVDRQTRYNAPRLNEDVVMDKTPRVTIHNLPGTALPVDVQLLLLEILGGEWAGLPNFSFVTTSSASNTTARVVSVRTVSLAQHYTLLHALASPSTAPLFAHASTSTSSTQPFAPSPTQRRVGGNLVWATDPNPERTAASFAQPSSSKASSAEPLEDPREAWEIPERERTKYIDEKGRRHLLLHNVHSPDATRTAVHRLLYREGILDDSPEDGFTLIVQTFPSDRDGDDTQIIHIVIPPRAPSTALIRPRPNHRPERPQVSRLYRSTRTMSPMELASPACPKLGEQPVWISETTKEEIRRLKQLKVDSRTDDLRNTSRKHKLKLNRASSSGLKAQDVLGASTQPRTLTLEPASAAPVGTSNPDEDQGRVLPPPETFADWYKPTYQAFKALRLFQLSRKPAWLGGGHASTSLLSSFFPSHQSLPSFFLPTSLFSSRHSSSSASPARYIPPIYKALLLPVFDLPPSSSATASRTLPPESQERLQHQVFLGGFPTMFSVGELRVWLVRRSLNVGEWTDVIRVVPTRPEGDRKGKGWEKRTAGSRKDREMEEWEGKRWWEASGKVGVEKLTQLGSWAPANFIVNVPTEADAHRVVRVLDGAEYIPPKINGITIRGTDQFLLEARILPTE